MSWVLELTDRIRDGLPTGDVLAACGFLLISIAALVIPFAGMRRRRKFVTREDEFQRLQNM